MSEQQFELNVPDMTCGHCVKAVTTAITATDPTAQVDISLADKRVSVSTSVTREAVVASVVDAGYTVV